MDYIFKNWIPNGITAIRILLLPILLYAYFSDFKFISIIIFVIVILSDVIDGYIARKLDSTSSWGAYFDVATDFILILMMFSAFTIKGVYPSWILLVILLMFLQFILTSKTKVLIYDPVGKYYGSFLFLVIFITLIISNEFVYLLLLFLIIVFTIISILSRLFSFFLIKKELMEGFLVVGMNFNIKILEFVKVSSYLIKSVSSKRLHLAIFPQRLYRPTLTLNYENYKFSHRLVVFTRA